MKKLLVICCLLSLTLIACGAFSVTPMVIVVTATSAPAQETATLIPIQKAATPTRIPLPTVVPSPVDTIAPITVTMIDQTLLQDGYLRYPFSSNSRTGFSYIKQNAWELISLYDDGQVQLEVLSGSSAQTRSQHMEVKFKVLDKVFPAGFMSELRKESDNYNQSIPTSISSIVSDSSKCPYSNNYNNEWQTKNIECNLVKSTIESLPVIFALWFYQVTCPPQYDYCYWNDFPGAEYVGQSSFTFYDIYINFIPGQSTSQGGYLYIFEIIDS